MPIPGQGQEMQEERNGQRQDLQKKEGKRLRGITVFGYLLVISSLIHMQTLVFGYAWYKDNFLKVMPEWLVIVRYCFSWFQRIVGLLSGIEILRRKDIFRKIAIALFWFTIFTVYLKHPYAAFKNHSQYLDRILGPYLRSAGLPGTLFSSVTLPALITHCLLDIAFAGSFIYYFTRQKVKQQFLK